MIGTSRRGAAHWAVPAEPPAAEVDVLIPTAGRSAELAVTLAGLAAQDDPPFRVVLSDQSNAGAETAPAVRSMFRVLRAQGRPVEVHRHMPRRGMAEQRQFLLDRASAGRNLFLHDGARLAPGSLRRLDEALSELDCGFVGYAVQGLSYLGDPRPEETSVFEPWEGGEVRPERVRPGEPAFGRWRLHNAANPAHLAAQRRLDDDAHLPYRIAWIGGCGLFDRDSLVEAGGFDFWRRLPTAHAGEDRAAQWRVMERFGGAGILPSGAVHLEAPTTVEDRRVEASDLVFPRSGREDPGDARPPQGARFRARQREETPMSERPNPIQIQKFLGGVDYPASREELLRAAREAGASDDVIDALDRLPDRDYEKPTDVSGAVSGG